MKIKHGVSSKRYEGGDFFLRKALHERTDFLRKVYRGLFYIGTNDQIMQEVGESFTNEHWKSENFPRTWWEKHLKINFNQSIELWKDLSLSLMFK